MFHSVSVGQGGPHKDQRISTYTCKNGEKLMIEGRSGIYFLISVEFNWCIMLHLNVLGLNFALYRILVF